MQGRQEFYCLLAVHITLVKVQSSILLFLNKMKHNYTQLLVSFFTLFFFFPISFWKLCLKPGNRNLLENMLSRHFLSIKNHYHLKQLVILIVSLSEMLNIYSQNINTFLIQYWLKNENILFKISYSSQRIFRFLFLFMILL